MADLAIVAANFVPSSNAKFKSGIAGETITQGQPVYLKTTDNLLYKAKNTTPIVGLVYGIAANAASVGQPLNVVYEDDDLQVGTGAFLDTTKVYVLSGTFGGICPSSDFGTASYLTVLFVPKSVTNGVMKLLASGALS